MALQDRRYYLSVAVALLVVLAGCGGGGTGTQTTGTGPASTAVSTGTTGPTTATGSTATAGDGTATPEYREVSANATAIRRDALAAMRRVETYRLTFVNAREVRANRVTQSVNITARGAFDRTSRELRVNRTITGPGGTVSVRVYVTDRTVYQRSPAYVRQYDSKWIKVDIAANFSARWDLLDTLARQRAILNASDVTVLGATTIDGTDVYVLRADMNETAYTELIRARLDTATEINVTDARFTFWIDTDTGRPLRSAGVVNSTAVINGQVVSVHEEFHLRFTGYGAPVNVTLPPAAETAVAVGNTTDTDG